MLVQVKLQRVYLGQLAAFASDKAVCLINHALLHAACAKFPLRRLRGLAGM